MCLSKLRNIFIASDLRVQGKPPLPRGKVGENRRVTGYEHEHGGVGGAGLRVHAPPVCTRQRSGSPVLSHQLHDGRRESRANLSTLHCQHPAVRSKRAPFQRAQLDSVELEGTPYLRGWSKGEHKGIWSTSWRKFWSSSWDEIQFW